MSGISCSYFTPNNMQFALVYSVCEILSANVCRQFKASNYLPRLHLSCPQLNVQFDRIISLSCTNTMALGQVQCDFK